MAGDSGRGPSGAATSRTAPPPGATAARPTPDVAPTATTTPTPVPLERLAVTLIPVAEGLEEPVGLASAGDGSGRLYVAEKAGRVRVVAGGAVRARPFLDIRDRVGDGASEQGLLGLAFHPDYGADPSERRFYVNYTDTNGDTVIAAHRVRTDGAGAEPVAERTVLTVAQPAANHNGGHLAFGPDGYLYVGLGDGGGAGDRHGNAQDPATLLGKMLRLDVDGEPPYGIPADNPFVGREPWRAEIWAYGLRNPWRYSFDGVAGDLYIGDVGQATWEEVSRQPAADGGGQDYGWPRLEGNHCFEGGTDCDAGGEAVRPILEYEHGADGCAVTGGYVYRGRAAPAVGTYVFGDYCSGKIWAARPVPGRAWVRVEIEDTELAISSFGEGDDGELYVADFDTGTVFRLGFGLRRSGGGRPEEDAGPKAPGGPGGYPR